MNSKDKKNLENSKLENLMEAGEMLVPPRAPWGSITHTEHRAPRGSLTPEEARERKNARQREYRKIKGYQSDPNYQKENTKMIGVRFVLSTEGDLLEYLETKPNKSGYIKGLIREDMEKNE